MSKAENFIRNHTSNCSNVVACSGMIEGGGFRYHKWLTPDQARRAVEIAREEIYEWLNSHSENYVYYWMDEEFGKDDMINDLKQAMKDE